MTTQPEETDPVQAVQAIRYATALDSDAARSRTGPPRITKDHDDGTHHTDFMIDWPDWRYVGSVFWDKDGFLATDIWWDEINRRSWYYQDRDEGKPHEKIVQTNQDGILRHIHDRRMDSCDTAIRGLTLEQAIRRYF